MLMRKLNVVPILLVTLQACTGSDSPTNQALDQAQLNSMAEKMQVNYRVVENRGDGNCTADGEGPACHIAQLTLTSPVEISARGWDIYFGLRQDPAFDVRNDEFVIEHINGDFHRLSPTEKFTGFSRGESKTIEFAGTGLVQSESVLLPNYYIAAKGLEPRIIKSTKVAIDAETGLEMRPYVTALTDPDTQFKSSANDKTEWPTAQRLFQINKDVEANVDSIDAVIIPTPTRTTRGSGGTALDAGIKLHLQDIDRAAMQPAIDRLALLGVRENDGGVPVSVSLGGTDTRVPESYLLDISQAGIIVEAADSAGAFYGLQSLAALIMPGSTDIPAMRVVDDPLYEFRGLHIDVSRNFHSKELMLKIIDQMAAYKLNKLHLHLGDDEGWRMEILGLPELTDISSKRCHDLAETTCLLPTLGSGPYSDTELNGYYSIQDYKELVQAAAARNIQVIPSFDMPGHSRAAIKAMEMRYQKFMDKGEESKALEYLLTDLDDTTVYQSIQSYDDNTINVCMESTYSFINKIIDEMKAVHAEAGQPLTRYHLGADETAGAWVESPACKEFLADNAYGVETIQDLNAHFVERVVNMLAQKGVEVAGWHDGIAKADPDKMPKVQTNIWTPIYEGAAELTGQQAEHDWLAKGAHESAHEQVNNGWEVVLSTPEALYFDFPYSADPKEHGQNWGVRELSTRDVFNFMPDNLPAHAEFGTDKLGHPYTIDDRVQRDEHGDVIHQPRREGREIAGIQAQIWSETLRSDALVEYMLFPRLMALAERAWHKPAWAVPYSHEGAVYSRSTRAFTEKKQAQRDAQWNQFAHALAQKVLPKLDLVNIQYRIPPVGAQIEDGVLTANIEMPGLVIEYRVDEKDWRRYENPVEIDGQHIEVRAIAPDGKRKGRSLSVL